MELSPFNYRKIVELFLVINRYGIKEVKFAVKVNGNGIFKMLPIKWSMADLHKKMYFKPPLEACISCRLRRFSIGRQFLRSKWVGGVSFQPATILTQYILIWRHSHCTTYTCMYHV